VSQRDTQQSRRVNMQDVARVAEVSKATVSRVIHSPELVKESTRRRIHEAMEQTGYVYNAVAADFTRQRNSIVGLIAFTLRGSIQSDFIEGIQETLDLHRYSLIIGNSRYDPATERELIRVFRERQLAGIIAAECTDDNRPALQALRDAGIPTILTWELTEDLAQDCVGIDNTRAAREMTEYLIGLGHRRIALIAGRYERIERVRHRFQGYRSALEAAGLEFDPALTVSRTPTALEGKLATSELLTSPNPPTAIFAASDALALGALAAAREHGFDVPRDISISGFDDSDFAPFCHPPLTTVRVPTLEMGKRAAQAVIKRELVPSRSEWDSGAIRIALDTEIVVRNSCGPPSRRVRPS